MSSPKDTYASMKGNEVSVSSIDARTRGQFERTARQVN